MAGNSQIDISQLPAPSIVETLSFDDIFARNMGFVVASDPDYTALLPSDSGYKLVQLVSWIEVNLRKRANDAAIGVMLAYAKGSDLEQIGARYQVFRLTIVAADPTTTPPTAAVMELDADLKVRIQLAYEGLTTAGSVGSYIAHALGADGDVKDVSPLSLTPGYANIFILSRSGTGAASAGLIAKVYAALTAELVRPFTDNVVVASADIVDYQISAELTFYDGPDAEVVRAASEAAVRAYVESVRRIGYDVTLSGLYAALHQPGVQSVNLITPPANIAISDQQAAFCTAVSVTSAGTSE